jgi:hypothetical protein
MMLEMVHDRVKTGMARMVGTAAVLPCGKQWKNYHSITFPG